MQVFTRKKFRDLGYEIPNLDQTMFTIRHGDNEHHIVHVPTNKTLVTFSRGWPYISHVDVEAITNAGLNSQPGPEGQFVQTDYLGVNVLDDIYYMFNPIKFFKQNGTPYAASITKLSRRINDQNVYLSNTTKALLVQFSTYIKTKLSQTHPTLVEGTPEYAKVWNSNLTVRIAEHIAKCEMTGIQLRYGLVKRVRISNVSNDWKGNYISREIQPELLGYNQHSLHIPGVGRIGVYLKENEMIIDNQVITLDNVEYRHCSCCNRDLPTQLFDGDSTTCITCEAAQYTIHSYSTRAEQLLSFKAKKVKPDTIYLGCELEFETSNRDAARLKVGKALAGHAIMKSDGSIRNGFEVVTCPATLEIQLDVFKQFYDKRPEELRNASNVGMHVHVSRKPLSLLTVGKLTRFMNHPDNKSFIEKLAGRPNNSYCRQEARRSDHLSYPLLTQTRSERYNVLNLCNQNTIEFRIFSTPLTYEDFASKMQFVQALVEYSKPCAVNLTAYAHYNWQAFKDWVLTQRKAYPELTAKLV